MRRDRYLRRHLVPCLPQAFHHLPPKGFLFLVFLPLPDPHIKAARIVCLRFRQSLPPSHACPVDSYHPELFFVLASRGSQRLVIWPWRATF